MWHTYYIIFHRLGTLEVAGCVPNQWAMVMQCYVVSSRSSSVPNDSPIHAYQRQTQPIETEHSLLGGHNVHFGGHTAHFEGHCIHLGGHAIYILEVKMSVLEVTMSIWRKPYIFGRHCIHFEDHCIQFWRSPRPFWRPCHTFWRSMRPLWRSMYPFWRSQWLTQERVPTFVHIYIYIVYFTA